MNRSRKSLMYYIYIRGKTVQKKNTNRRELSLKYLQYLRDIYANATKINLEYFQNLSFYGPFLLFWTNIGISIKDGS